MVDGENNIRKLVKGLNPKLNDGEYVFTTVNDIESLDIKEVICTFREEKGITLVLKKSKADQLGLKYYFIASWITLKIHSSLNAVGLTSIFSTELAKNKISCNIIAGYYHDHIFVPIKDSLRALNILRNLSD